VFPTPGPPPPSAGPVNAILWCCFHLSMSNLPLLQMGIKRRRLQLRQHASLSSGAMLMEAYECNDSGHPINCAVVHRYYSMITQYRSSA
jgi:hypothetical protein